MPTPGSCKLCESVYSTIINRLIEQEKNEADVKRVMAEIDADFYWTRQTFYAHKKHITHPLISAARKARENPVIAPKTTEGFLELVRDAGIARVMEDPDSVKLRDALKASEILERKASPKDQMFVLLAKAMTLQLPDTAQEQFVIDAEYRVLGDGEEGGELAAYETDGRGRPDANPDRSSEGGPQADRQGDDAHDLDETGAIRDAGGGLALVQRRLPAQ